MLTLFNDNWQFTKIHLESAESPIPDLAELIKDESRHYEPVKIPHDWLIWNTNDLYENSIGIYKKTLHFSEADDLSEQRRYIRFEGVYMDSTVFVNGEKAFVWKYGYTTFEVDITNFLKEGDNVIHVVAVYRSPNTRWYSGAGIYRNVWLRTVPQTHLVADGVYVSNRKVAQSADETTGSGFDCAANSAKMHSAVEWVSFYQVEVVSHTAQTSVTVKTTLLSADGTEIASETKPLVLTSPGSVMESSTSASDPTPSFAVCSGEFHLQDIRVWDIADPYLYTLKTELFDIDGTLLDSCTQKIGFRTIEYNADKGFFLNGRHVKIHGACLHHDLGCLGSAFNKSALKRQFKKMVEMGVNSIRTSHNPPAPEFLELADETGMLIDCECFDQWERAKTKYDYSHYFKEYHARDVASWIRRDRNHPCIIMWSIGNEIYDTHLGTGLAIAKDLTALVHKYDFKKNAPATIGSNYIEWENAQECMKEVDLAGYNYAERLYAEHHKKYPDWKIYGSETSSTVQSRGIYHFPADFRTLTHDDQQCSCLGNCSSNWGAINTTMAIVPDRDAEFCIGQYIWTGWDYIGEPTPYFTKNSYFGQIDTAGFKKDTFYLYQAEWTDYHKNPMIHLLPYWDFNENQIIDVKAYSNAPIVELFFNGKSFGKQEIDHKHGKVLEGHWKLPYHAGTLVAVAYDENGNFVAEDTKTSFKDPAKIVLSYEREDNLIFVDISTCDINGVPVENARNRINVDVEGGELLGLDNGDSTDYEQYKCNSRKLFNNHLLAIVRLPSNERPEDATSERSSGAVRITAVSKDLEPAVLIIGSAGDIQANFTIKPDDEVPVRKIELTVIDAPKQTGTEANCSLALSAESPCVTIKARILPENATFRTLEWKPCRIEGVQTSSAKVEVLPDGLTARLSAAGDGNFRLRCTASNGKPHPDAVSELEFSISGMGSGTLNPYQLISACEYSAALNEPKQSFQGGVYVPAERNWLLFENLDFGSDGSDEFSIPIFSFDASLPLELWEGNPDNGGKKLMAFEYLAASWYNHYQANTWKLPRRLTGIHSLSILSTTRFSIQGIQFVESPKAFAKLFAADADRITGDSFQKQEDCITGIGNNVSLEFGNMDFGAEGTTSIKIEGRAINGTNTVHIKFTPIGAECIGGESGQNTEPRTCIAEIPQSNEIMEHRVSLGECIKGKQNVTFVFLPGSCFDFKSFKFER
ncbi:MAG: DUF4982 domain-containing protein [Spirochaetaceae bacterium]|nr:DUF4982 domain-containing protein [Spirochaetaceae bacterium]